MPKEDLNSKLPFCVIVHNDAVDGKHTWYIIDVQCAVKNRNQQDTLFNELGIKTSTESGDNMRLVVKLLGLGYVPISISHGKYELGADLEGVQSMWPTHTTTIYHLLS